MEAYVLAGELERHGGDHAIAFANYEQRLKPFLAEKQTSASKFASSFVPKTKLGLVFRDLVIKFLRIPFIADYFVGRDLNDKIDLPDYENS